MSHPPYAVHPASSTTQGAGSDTSPRSAEGKACGALPLCERSSAAYRDRTAPRGPRSPFVHREPRPSEPISIERRRRLNHQANNVRAELHADGDFAPKPPAWCWYPSGVFLWPLSDDRRSIESPSPLHKKSPYPSTCADRLLRVHLRPWCLKHSPTNTAIHRAEHGRSFVSPMGFDGALCFHQSPFPRLLDPPPRQGTLTRSLYRLDTDLPEVLPSVIC